MEGTDDKQEEKRRVILDWETYLSDIYALADILKATGQVGTCVFGDPPDGIIPGFLIAQAVGIEFLDGPKAMSARLSGGRVLVVFGVLGSGVRVVPYRNDGCTAAVYVRRDCRLKPTVHLHDIGDEWLVFPYDRGALASSKRIELTRDGNDDGGW